MLTKDQKLILALRVNENKDVVFAKYGPGVTKKMKEQIWESIRQVLLIQDNFSTCNFKRNSLILLQSYFIMLQVHGCTKGEGGGRG